MHLPVSEGVTVLKPKPATPVSLVRLSLLVAPLILAVLAIKLASAAHAQGPDPACEQIAAIERCLPL